MPAVSYWLQGQPVQNMGDFLTELFLARVGVPGPARYPRMRLIGSVIADHIIAPDLRAAGEAAIGYWGCGQRDEFRINPRLQARCRFHGVRGPLTRNRLGLPPDTVLGDPALILPLLYKPQILPQLHGRTIYVPHYREDLPEAMLLAQTGANLLVRPNIPNAMEALLNIIDMICSADFVLAGALHAGIIACAYGRPFAFHTGAYIDIPFKFLDFAASVNIPALFARNVEEGRRAWSAMLEPCLQIPPLAPILGCYPGEIQPGLISQAEQWDQGAAFPQKAGARAR